ncbi:MAG: MFS transporter, partial [Bacteroidota bacterium]
MFVLILAGEAAFFLPFVLARVFRPTFLAVFELTNLELGVVYSMYGMVAVGAYLFGGPLADRFSARKLIPVSLAVTALGGFYMASFPDFAQMKLLFAFWGLSTILLFWAAMIRAARELGGPDHQGKTFGLLDGGRGLVAAGLASLLVLVFAAFLPESTGEISPEARTEAFRQVIYVVTVFVLIVAVLVFLFFRPPTPKDGTPARSRISLQNMRSVLEMPTVWLQAIIIVCAYVGYKATDDFSLYAREVMGYEEVEAAGLGTLSFWVRPVVAVLAGFVADRFRASSTLIISFAIVCLGALGLGSGMLEPGLTTVFILTVVTTSTGIFALRGLYFAITQEGKVPLAYMGTAVGLMSIIGYTPDIFFGPLMGVLLDGNPGALGHQYVFLVLAGFSLVGMVAGFVFRWWVRR